MTDVSHPGASPLNRTPSLYVLATPLGNLGDISRRALDVLAAVDLIAAEDTRHSQRLLDAYGIRTPLKSLHEHNENRQTDMLIEQLAAGRHVALISDAGTPAVSDPGARAVARVRTEGFPVIPVPGPCALVAALSVSGFSCDAGFRFVGFLPPKDAARRKIIEQLRSDPATLVFYEAPHRIVACVEDLTDILDGERTLMIARELTKLHEETVTLPLQAASAWLTEDANRRRGEFVLIVTGAPATSGCGDEEKRILSLLLAELPLKTAVKLATQITGAPRNALYDMALETRTD